MGLREYKTRIHDEIRTHTFWRDVIAECVSTFFLVSVQAALPMSWGVGIGGPVQVSLGMGFIVTTIAWTMGDFGGAHMNPAVTICMAMRLDITIVRAILYIIVQCLGSLAGAAYIYILTPADMRGRLAVTSLGPGVTPVQGVFLEAWITSIMVITIIGSTNSRRKQGAVFMKTLPIGLAVTLGIMAAFVSTGASMNPARSLGPAIMMGLWENHWVYWVGPILGSCVAGIVYHMFDRVDINKFDDMNTKPGDKVDSNVTAGDVAISTLSGKTDNEDAAKNNNVKYRNGSLKQLVRTDSDISYL